MNKALVSLGSNEDREANIALCGKLLDTHFEEVTYSVTSVTKPYGAIYNNDFLNQLAFISTHKTQEEVASLLKSLEKEMGRSSTDKQYGIVKIDIDLVIWNNQIVKPEDMSRHYISDLMPPNYFCDNSTLPKD